MRVIYVSRCKVCPCLVTTSCGVRCFYAPPTSSILGDLNSISPDCPLAEMPTAENIESKPETAELPSQHGHLQQIKAKIAAQQEALSSSKNIGISTIGINEFEAFLRQLSAID